MGIKGARYFSKQRGLTRHTYLQGRIVALDNTRNNISLAEESTIRDQIRIVSWIQERDKLLIEEQSGVLAEKE